jgi:preprotein translocase subunit YajC
VLLAASGGGSNLSFLVIMALFIGVAYFMLIRPQQRRARAVASMQSQIKPGDEVMTIGGLYGTVEAIDDESVWIQPSPEVTLRFRRNAVAQVTDAGAAVATDADVETETPSDQIVDKND